MTHSLSNLQLELLKLYSTGVSEEDLLNIRRLMVQYFADKITRQMDELIAENEWSPEDMQAWAKAHIRTPYPDEK